MCVLDEDGHILKAINSFKQYSARRLPETGVYKPAWIRDFWDRHVREHEDYVNVEWYIANTRFVTGSATIRWIGHSPREMAGPVP